MDSRQRLMDAVERKPIDRVPADFQAVSEAIDKLKRYFKTENYEDILKSLSIDTRWIYPASLVPVRTTADGCFFGFGGSKSKLIKNEHGTHLEIVKYSLDDITAESDIDERLLLQPMSDFDFTNISKQCEEYAEYGKIAGAMSVFYYLTLVRNMEDVLIDMALNPELVYCIVKRIADWHYEYHKNILEAGNGNIEIIQIADDFATQQDLLISTDMFRTFFKDELKRYVKLCKSYGAKVMFHCCGSAYKIVSELVDIGVDILDPIQTKAVNMEPEKLKKEFGNVLSFHGGVDGQETLPYGTPDAVRREARHLVNILGRGGGYILGSCHLIQADVPVENILALFDLENR